MRVAASRTSEQARTLAREMQDCAEIILHAGTVSGRRVMEMLEHGSELILAAYPECAPEPEEGPTIETALRMISPVLSQAAARIEELESQLREARRV